MKHLFGSSKSLIALIIAFVITVSLGGVAYAETSSTINQQQEALSRTNASLVLLGKQYKQDADLISVQKKLLESGVEHLGSVESSAGFIIGDVNLKDVSSEKNRIQELLKTVPVKFPLVDVAAVKTKGMFPWDYKEAVAKGHRKLDTAMKLKNSQTKLFSSLQTEEKAAQAVVSKVVSSIDASSDALLGANSKAAPEVRNSFVQAKSVVKSQSSVSKNILDDQAFWASFTAWVAAGKSVVDSHAAAVLAEQQAAAEAAAKQAAEANSGGSSSGSGGLSAAPKPSSGNRGSSSGSGSSNGGTGASSPGGSSSGSSPAPSPSKPGPKVVRSGPCNPAIVGQSVSYGSTLVVPTDALNVKGPYDTGDGYSISWQCDTGW